MDSSEYVGKRIVCEGHYGTVVYYGPVPPTEGLWLGVDWDEPSRGKHNGTYENVKYFDTRYPTSGSFLRPQKADFGITYVQGIKERYSFDKIVTETEMYIMGDNQVIKPVELIGMDKIGEQQSNFNLLKEICLYAMKIRGYCKNEDAIHITPNVVELVLSKNLLASWQDVARIVGNMENLRSLNLSENHLKLPESISENLMSSFKTLTEIALNRMNYDWNDILKCAEIWPQIQQLLIPFNSIASISQPNVDLFRELITLDMESNPIIDWTEIRKLGHLPRLKYLNVSNCGIQTISFPEIMHTEKTSSFPELEILGLNDNNCNKWSDITELNKLHKLIELRMRNNPICEKDSPQTVRQLFIAKIGNLKMLNRVQVTPGERKGAELDYLKRYGQIWLDLKRDFKNDNLPLDFTSEHPRYVELVTLYGAAEESELKKQNTTLKNKLVSIKICSPNFSDRPPFTKKLPLTMSVQKVRGMIEKLLRVDSQETSLSYVSGKQKTAEFEIPLDNDFKELNHYSIEDGDTILVRW